MAAAAQEARALGDRERDRLASIAGALESEAERRVGQRSIIEQRWLEDLRQYHGRYDEKTNRDLKDSKKSQVFINQTRPKTNAMEARLSDMLFPTDDRNWGIGPTPVPELTIEGEEAAKRKAQAKLALVDQPNDPGRINAAAAADAEMQLLQERVDEAKKRSRSMEEEIDDHLRECQYSAQAREVIRDACKLGTGIMKGPVTDGTHRRSWKRRGQNVYELQFAKDERPRYWRVDPWNFFPDMDVQNPEDSEGFYERHLLNRKQARRLARNPTFDKDAVRRLLKQEPDSKIPTYISDLRSITGAYNDTTRDRYCVWEYHGPLTTEQMQEVAAVYGDDEMSQELEDHDPLDELEVVIWFCQGEILKWGVHHLDSNDAIYSVFCLEKDEACIFGFGVPFIMRDPQTTLAAAWRALLDNMGLSAGPQIVVNRNVVEPLDGDWTITPRKLWLRKQGAPKDMRPFEVFQITSNANDLLAIVEKSKENIDDETALPIIAQGEQGTHVTKTAQGMGLLMNSVNVVFRRIVKNWDDDMTTPNIRRMYDYLMQFSDKNYIKGDFQVDARGTSVLLVRELQAANLMMFLLQFGASPQFSKFLKEEGVPGLRSLCRAMMIPANELIKTDPEIEQMRADEAEKGPPINPEMEKIAATLNLEKMKGETELMIEGVRRETSLLEIAAKNNMGLEELRAKLQVARESLQSKERTFAAEAALEARKDARGDQSGSGGSLS